MGLFTRTSVANAQAAAITSDTASRRAAKAAGSGRRSIGTTRSTVVPPATGRAQPIVASTTR